MRVILASIVSLVLAWGASAAPTDVVFRGGGHFISTSGCDGWNPDKEFFVGTYWVPVPGSTNGPHSTITFHFGNGTAEGFFLANGVFNSTFKSVQATHVYTLTGTYSAFVKITSRTPATLSTSTNVVTIVGAVRGCDRDPNCITNFRMALVRDLDP